jgi:hypothetical protein
MSHLLNFLGGEGDAGGVAYPAPGEVYLGTWKLLEDGRCFLRPESAVDLLG